MIDCCKSLHEIKMPESLKEHNQTPLAFKRSLLKYYTNAVDIFDQEDKDVADNLPKVQYR